MENGSCSTNSFASTSMCAPLSTLALSLLKKVKVHNKDVSPRFPETPDMLVALKMVAIVKIKRDKNGKYDTKVNKTLVANKQG